jgi:hypothetical protein
MAEGGALSAECENRERRSTLCPQHTTPTRSLDATVCSRVLAMQRLRDALSFGAL